MIPWCIVLSLSAHVLLLAGAAPSGPRLGAPGSWAPAAARPVRMTLVPPAASPAPVDAATPAGDAPAPAAVLQRTSGVATSSVASATSSASAASSVNAGAVSSQTQLEDAPSTSTSTSASTAASAPPAASAPAVAAAGTGTLPVTAPDDWAPGNPARGAYLPRPLLSIAPRIEAEVPIAMPPGADDGRRHVGVLSLFIDERGRVVHVEPDEQLLPPAMEQAAREAFMAARFSPGQVAGRAVKSRLNVEVAFDSESPAAARPAASGASAAGRAASAQRSP